MTREEAIRILQLNKDRLCNSVRIAVEVLMEEVGWKSVENEPKAPWKSGEKPRKKFGERIGVFRSLEVGDKADVEIRDDKDWTSWRSTATYMLQTYGCIFKVSINQADRTRLTITRQR